MHPEIRRPGRGLPDLRDGARARHGDRRHRSEPRAGRHDPPVLGRRGPVRPGAGAGDGRGPVPGPARRHLRRRRPTWIQLVLATPVVLWAGWPFFERGWTSVRTLKLNMFTLIAMGTGVAWLFSVVATVAPGHLPRLVPDGRHGRRLLRGRRRHHHPGAARAGPGAARPRADLRRHPGPAGPDPEDRAPARPGRHRGRGAPSTRSRSGTGSGSGPARRSRSTGSSRRAAPPWTSRWSPASRCRSPRPPATPSSAAPSTRPGRWSCAPTRSAGTRCSPGSCRWSPKRNAPGHPSSGWPTRSPPGSCRPSSASPWSRSSSGPPSDPTRGWPTPWSSPSPS